jgi:hypothetical protein
VEGNIARVENAKVENTIEVVRVENTIEVVGGEEAVDARVWVAQP